MFAARLLGHRVPSGGAVECLLLSLPAAGRDGVVECDALMHPGQKLKPGARVRFEGPAGALMAEVLERQFFGRRRIRLSADGQSDAAAVEALVDALGHMPLPPYIKRPDVAADRERYQTMFAAQRGSVAAPTAGLHFTPQIVGRARRQGVERRRRHAARRLRHLQAGARRARRGPHRSIPSRTRSASRGGAPSTARAPKGGA